jgi:hypothetical protein
MGSKHRARKWAAIAMLMSDVAWFACAYAQQEAGGAQAAEVACRNACANIMRHELANTNAVALRVAMRKSGRVPWQF